MIVEDQSQTVAFLSEPSTHGAAEPVEVIETHISLVFLAGDRAYKLKRAVKLPYVDFSTLEKRSAACAKEVGLNSRTAPELYLGTRRIVRGRDGRLAFDGVGETVDVVVEMVRFEQEALLDRMAEAQKLTPRLMDGVAQMVADFHSEAEMVHAYGGADNMAGVLDINAAGFATSHVFAPAEVEALNATFHARLEEHRELLDAREAEGRVRRCHGDLHLRNICFFRGRPQLFDCIEFDDKLATVDVLYDLAFLLMDLWHRDLPELANRVMNRYLDVTGDNGGFAVLPFFMAVRAAVRAHVTATQVEESRGDTSRLVKRAREHFELARHLLEVVPPRVIAVGGLSGSGKTTVAESLAPMIGAPPGARITETDRIRKAMYGVPVETRLPLEAYTPEVSERVYRALAARTHSILSIGGTVLVDALFDRPENRALIEETVAETGAPFTGVWLDADPETLRQRISQRSGGPSDATVDVLEKQLKHDPGPIDWMRFDAHPSPAALARSILEASDRQIGRQAAKEERDDGHDA